MDLFAEAEKEVAKDADNKRSGNNNGRPRNGNQHNVKSKVARKGARLRIPFVARLKQGLMGMMLFVFMYGIYLYTEVPEPGDATQNLGILAACLWGAATFIIKYVDPEDYGEEDA